MRIVLKRNSKIFLLLFFSSIFAIIGGIITTIKTPMNLSVSGLYLILAGIGLFFLVLSISTKDQKSVRTWAIYSGIFMVLHFFVGLISFRSGHIITAKIVALWDIVILLTLYSIISTLGGKHMNKNQKRFELLLILFIISVFGLGCIRL